MNKKDYIAIAGIVKETREQGIDTSEIFCSTLVSKLARLFTSDNACFNSAKFRAACYGKGKGDE